jgi:hypothetical protein
MKVPRFRGLGLLALWLVLVPVSARAELILVSPGLVYDTVQNLTWAQNVNLGGDMTFAEANTFVDSLVFGGFDDWRLPQHNQANCPPECPTAWDSEVSRALVQLGWHWEGPVYVRGSAGPLLNFDPDARTLFWLGPGLLGSTTSGLFRWTWQYDTDLVDPGSQTMGHAWVWAVRDGAPAGIPEPSTLLLVGLGALAAARKRRVPIAR